jgi:hypothetical protein
MYGTHSRAKPARGDARAQIFLPEIFEKGEKMNCKLEAKIQKKIRTRTFKHLDKIRQERQRLQNEKYTLDALHEVTGLPLWELEAIANEVMLSFEVIRDDFFSIKNQILISFGISGFVIILGCLLFMI